MPATLNRYYISVFLLRSAPQFQFQFWKKMLWRWPDVLKRCDERANSFSEYPVQIGKDLSGIDSGKCAFGEPWCEGHMFNWDTITWTWKNFEIWAFWMAENALEILQMLYFLYLKAWPSPDFQRFKSLDPPPLLRNFIDDPPLWSPSPPPSPTPTPQ